MRPVPLRRSVRLLPLLAALAACATPQIREGKPVRFTEAPSPGSRDAFPNWPTPPITSFEQELRFDRARHEVRSVKGAGGGVTGADQVDFDFFLPGLHRQVMSKGRKAPAPRIDGWNNAPRKELAAASIQTLFLDPHDFVVPSAMMRCIPLDEWEGLKGAGASPSVPGTKCVLVMLAMWLQDVTLPDPLYDEERFLTDANYAYFLGNFNILTYLVDHRDNRTGNFLVAKDDRQRRVFAIDNGVTFGAKLFNWFFPWSYAWRKIQVPALPRQAVDRLRQLEREDLDKLMVVQQLEPDEKGILRIVAPGPVIDPDQGATVQGTTVQLGLRRKEIDQVWARTEALVQAVDSGRMPVF